MGSDPWFENDVRSILVSAATANKNVEAVTSSDLWLAGYFKGYGAALTTIALAFGLSPEELGLVNVVEISATLQNAESII
jgi:hypothetical protein